MAMKMKKPLFVVLVAVVGLGACRTSDPAEPPPAAATSPATLPPPGVQSPTLPHAACGATASAPAALAQSGQGCGVGLCGNGSCCGGAEGGCARGCPGMAAVAGAAGSAGATASKCGQP